MVYSIETIRLSKHFGFKWKADKFHDHESKVIGIDLLFVYLSTENNYETIEDTGYHDYETIEDFVQFYVCPELEALYANNSLFKLINMSI